MDTLTITSERLPEFTADQNREASNLGGIGGFDWFKTAEMPSMKQLVGDGEIDFSKGLRCED